VADGEETEDEKLKRIFREISDLHTCAHHTQSKLGCYVKPNTGRHVFLKPDAVNFWAMAVRDGVPGVSLRCPPPHHEFENAGQRPAPLPITTTSPAAGNPFLTASTCGNPVPPVQMLSNAPWQTPFPFPLQYPSFFPPTGPCQLPGPYAFPPQAAQAPYFFQPYPPAPYHFSTPATPSQLPSVGVGSPAKAGSVPTAAEEKRPKTPPPAPSPSPVPALAPSHKLLWTPSKKSFQQELLNLSIEEFFDELQGVMEMSQSPEQCAEVGSFEGLAQRFRAHGIGVSSFLPMTTDRDLDKIIGRERMALRLLIRKVVGRDPEC
jgi:hypothetical protein